MREPPDDLDEAAVRDLVAVHWSGQIDRVTHLPIGFGAHHWRAEHAGVPVWFVTYDRLGSRHDAQSLAAAYGGAIELAGRGLQFVLAPTPALDGHVLVPTAGGALSCTGWMNGSVVGDGPLADPDTARQNVADLARLHTATAPAGIPRWRPVLDEGFVARLEELVATPWALGPYGEPARTAIVERLPRVDNWLDRYVDLARDAGKLPWVATHGETHTANQLRTADGIRFVDWESLKLAPRERDLSTLVQAGYADPVHADPAMVQLFDLEWRLSEIDAYARWFAAAHTGTADDTIAYGGLLAELSRGPWWRSPCP